MLKLLIGIVIGAPIGYITCCLMVVAGEGDDETTAQNKGNETRR